MSKPLDGLCPIVHNEGMNNNADTTYDLLDMDDVESENLVAEMDMFSMPFVVIDTGLEFLAYSAAARHHMILLGSYDTFGEAMAKIVEYVSDFNALEIAR